MADVLRLENVSRRFKEGEGQLEVFSALNMALAPGEIVALVGQSGAGKSSLLHIAGLLEAPSSGEIYIAGAAASRLPDSERRTSSRSSAAAPAAMPLKSARHRTLERRVMPSDPAPARARSRRN